MCWNELYTTDFAWVAILQKTESNDRTTPLQCVLRHQQRKVSLQSSVNRIHKQNRDAKSGNHQWMGASWSNARTQSENVLLLQCSTTWSTPPATTQDRQ
ncbi:expressed protein [Batrachochytrium dendrobatidis JAM81]|uniref:Expressed protein n=1 Tax=Batrachochytrium dendrobatidis (strain JAM81 / FGSC 10211) TaxID=684364 RepID=F4NW22_BATDJ|nr:uncharacterized protein BATDEDRAFT_36613 [Batrachochytrium dendrobatidis JAM81]EGF82756.1 expressed protein [Batrachochytrium dendrobatidis JAM81]|eukprot:XP_006676845.1 expressed protein [Batrachochytrium dendrobatidis JAM81]